MTEETWDNERQYDSGDGDGDSRARISSWTGNGSLATAVQHGHETGAGDTQQCQRNERPGGRPDDAVRRTKHVVTEQPAHLYDLASPRWAVHRDDAESKEERQ